VGPVAAVSGVVVMAGGILRDEARRDTCGAARIDENE
jgi:hypothetical protein